MYKLTPVSVAYTHVIPNCTTLFWQLDQHRQALLHSNMSGGSSWLKSFDKRPSCRANYFIMAYTNAVLLFHQFVRRGQMPCIPHRDLNKDLPCHTSIWHCSFHTHRTWMNSHHGIYKTETRGTQFVSNKAMWWCSNMKYIVSPTNPVLLNKPLQMY